MTELKMLEDKIEKKRVEMESFAIELGFTHPVVIQISQQLDQLHNEWNLSCSHLKETNDLYLVRRYTSCLRRDPPYL